MAEETEDVGKLDPETLELFNKLNFVIKRASDAFSYIVIDNVRKAMKDPKIKAQVSHGILVYIAAAGALTFAGRDIEKEGVARLIKSVDILPEDELLDAVGVFRSNNALIYVMAIYFLVAAEKEPNVKNLLEVVKAMGSTPDISIADNMLVFYRDFEAKETAGTLDYSDSDSYVIVISEVVKKVGIATTQLVSAELKRGLMEPKVRPLIGTGLLPYIVAAGVLAYTGRDIDKWAIAKLVKSLGIDPEDEFLDAMSVLRFKNHIVYLISIYFLVAAGKEPTVDNLIKVVRAMYINPDSTLAAYSIRVFSKLEQ